MKRLDAYSMARLRWLGFGRLFVIKMYDGAMGSVGWRVGWTVSVALLFLGSSTHCGCMENL
jgi:hypothetical protein